MKTFISFVVILCASAALTAPTQTQDPTKDADASGVAPSASAALAPGSQPSEEASHGAIDSGNAAIAPANASDRDKKSAQPFESAASLRTHDKVHTAIVEVPVIKTKLVKVPVRPAHHSYGYGGHRAASSAWSQESSNVVLPEQQYSSYQPTTSLHSSIEEVRAQQEQESLQQQQRQQQQRQQQQMQQLMMAEQARMQAEVAARAEAEQMRILQEIQKAQQIHAEQMRLAQEAQEAQQMRLAQQAAQAQAEQMRFAEQAARAQAQQMRFAELAAQTQAEQMELARQVQLQEMRLARERQAAASFAQRQQQVAMATAGSERSGAVAVAPVGELAGGAAHGGLTGVFPALGGGGCGGIPLLVSCTPSLSRGSLLYGHGGGAGLGYGGLGVGYSGLGLGYGGLGAVYGGYRGAPLLGDALYREDDVATDSIDLDKQNEQPALNE